MIKELRFDGFLRPAFHSLGKIRTFCLVETVASCQAADAWRGRADGIRISRPYAGVRGAGSVDDLVLACLVSTESCRIGALELAYHHMLPRYTPEACSQFIAIVWVPRVGDNGASSCIQVREVDLSAL